MLRWSACGTVSKYWKCGVAEVDVDELMGCLCPRGSAVPAPVDLKC